MFSKATPQPQHEPRIPTQRIRSEAAAKAAQDMLDLENHIEQLKGELEMVRSHSLVVEESNKLLHEQVSVLEHENHDLRRIQTEINTRLSVCANILMDLRRPITEPPVDNITKQSANEQPAEKVSDGI